MIKSLILTMMMMVSVNATDMDTTNAYIEEQTGLSVDYVQEIDGTDEFNWYAYYVQADGDLYVITLDHDEVDVCVQLN